MPRLVSLTLLSALALPVGATVYFLAVVLGYEIFGWGDEELVFLLANLLTFSAVVLWWVGVWWKSVVWTPGRIAGSIAAGVGGLLVGTLLGFIVAAAANEEALGIFLGGCVAILGWLIAVCVIWRTSPLELARQQGSATDAQKDVRCPRCQYVLNGLREARCPECGEAYTLDALFAAQQTDARMET